MRNNAVHESEEIARIIVRAVRNDLSSFINKAFCELVPGDAYMPNWHLDAIAFRLEQVWRGEVKRLIITMPPRSLKSISASVAFPAFVHGHDPSRQIICVSYAQELAAKHQNDYRALLKTPWYRAIFPRTRISTQKDTESEVLLTGRGSRLATSVGGTLTGRGGDIIIIDDPLKAADAMSQPRREFVNEWVQSTLMSRLNDKRKDAVVVVTQRLHSDDLVGCLLERDPDRWTILNLPAIAPRDLLVPTGENRRHRFQAGDALHPAREPLSILEQVRREIGSDNFAAQYLQEPVPPGGVMFRRQWLDQRYDVAPNEDQGETIQSWDTASKTGPQNDWSVCTTWRVVQGRYVLIDVYRDRIDYPALRQTALSLARRYCARLVLVEDTSIGTGLATELRSYGVKCAPVQVSQGKEARAAVQTAKFEGGLVVLPRQARWLPEYEAELLAFPNGRHDDQVDSTVQALAYDLRRGRGGARPVIGLG